MDSIVANYKGGYVNIKNTVKSITVKIVDHELVFKQLWKTYYKLDIKNITDIQYKTSEEVSKDLTLTRLLAFGIFAFALKKKKTTKERYIIISTLEDGFQNDIVLEIEGIMQGAAQEFIKTLRNKVNIS